MAPYETLLVDEKEEVAVVTLNRPGKLNALSLTLLSELDMLMGEIDSRDDLKAVVVTGGLEVFCAGADISIFPGLGSPEEAYTFVQQIKRCLSSLRRLSKPSIAAICGMALGGGLELSLYCDIRISAIDSRLGLPEINLGAFPAAGGTQLLPRLVGSSIAKELLFRGEPITAQEALQIGLVNRVLPKEQVLPEAVKMARDFARKPAYAIRTIKRIVNTGLQMDIDRALTYESASFLGIWSSHDFKEGYSAFLSKRKPEFRGR